jgi:transcriptional regulator with XRE-family HTH domain
MTKAPKTPILSGVAVYLAEQIKIQAALGKTQKQIATELGYERPNMIAMMCSGDVKVPIDKVPALARALNVDIPYLMRLTLVQYWPEAGEDIAEVFGTVTRNEAKLLEIIRSAASHSDPEVTPELERKLRGCFE